MGATEARMDAAKLKESLENLLRKWRQRSYDQEHDWYNDCPSIDEFTEDLENIIKKVDDNEL